MSSVIEQNLARTKLEGRVRKQDVFAFLENAQIDQPFGVIFADPPYEKTKAGGAFTQMLLDNARLPQMLEPGGIFVLEKRPAERMPATPLWEIMRARRYGATEVLFLEPTGHSQ